MNEIDTLVAQLKTELCQKHLKLAVAESLTSGKLQSALGSISGASEFFEGGITVYSLKQKINLLNLDKSLVLAVNGVSATVAEQMAKAVAEKFAVNLAISTTGYAEPCPAQQIDHPIAYIALWHQQTPVKTMQINGQGLDRHAMQNLVVKTALIALLNYIQTQL